MENAKLDALKISIGLSVRAARRAADVNQEDLAATIGRSTATLSNIERGASLPPLDTLLSIAQALGRPVSAFIPKDDSLKSIKRLEIDAELVMLLSDLSDDQTEVALRLIRALTDGK